MKLFKNVLVGVDFSDSSIQALKQAARIASKERTKPTVVHVVTPSEIEDYYHYYSLSTDSTLQSFRQKIEGVLQDEVGSADAADYEVVIGVPYPELMRLVEETDSDLLVLGSRGANAGEAEVGYFAAKCVRHANVPVLLNRSVHGEPFKSVVACVDYSEVTKDVIETAAKIAVDEEAELHIVHAVSPPWMLPTHILYNLETNENEDYKAEYREMLEAEMEAVVRNASRFLPIEIKLQTIEHPDEGRALVNFLNEVDADLAVVGRTGRTGAAIKQFFLGSAAERLIHRSPCSVVTVPSRID